MILLKIFLVFYDFLTTVIKIINTVKPTLLSTSVPARVSHTRSEPLISEKPAVGPLSKQKIGPGKSALRPNLLGSKPVPGCYYTSVTGGGSLIIYLRGRRWLRQIPRCKRAYLIRDIAGPVLARPPS